MIIADYRIVDRIGATAGAELYRARCLTDETTVVLKRLDPDHASAAQAARFRREYQLLKSLNVPEVVEPLALIDERGCLAMVLENLAGESLETVLGRRPRMDLATALGIARDLALALAGLHAARVIHQDLRPVNILIAPESGRARLVDCSMATTQESETSSSEGGAAAIGDWAYLSPEQTGRMNRRVDYRTDFYSLGITLYRLLTGQLPFHADDPLEWAHCHIARMPRPLGEVAPELPQAVSDLVARLLAKLPEDRYQSAHGLQVDLARCLAQWQAGGRIAPFALGTEDVSDRFQTPLKLYGRQAERASLLAAFDRMAATGQAALVTVSGYSGIGKSALVHELHQPIVEKRGYFISGKFDQYQRDIPYATLTQAFGELVRQLLAESEARIAVWRQQIQAAVGVHGQLIVDVLPQVELIIGKQSPVQALASTEAKNRFHLVFRRFIGVLTRKDHPLVLFVDDLQWADFASLGLLSDLLTHAETRFLLVVGAYRDNEVSPAHPLAMMLDETRKQGAAIADVVLGPLSAEDLCSLVGDTLHCAAADAAPLAELIHQKTAGNPFFAIQFLGNLHEERLVQFDASTRAWRWDIAQIRAKNFTDNVVELMVEKLKRLPAHTQEALKQLACLGNAAGLELVAMVSGRSEADTDADLREAVQAGLVMRMNGSCRFLHDRVQEAAYSLIPEAARTAAHLRIGRMMRDGLAQEATAERVFDVANQLNRGLSGIADPAERISLARLNRLAGQKAKAAIAYASARSYFAQAAALLPEGYWSTQYEHAFALYLEISECEYLVGNFSEADRLFSLIIERARSALDRARVNQLRMKLYQVAGRYDEALSVALDTVRLFGITVPETGPEILAATQAEFREIAAHLEGRRIADIADAPRVADPEIGMLIALLTEAGIPAYYTRPALYPLLATWPVSLSLRYGNDKASCVAYSRYAVRLLSEFGDIASAFEFSELSIRLNEKFDDRTLRGRLLANHAGYFVPWRQHISHAAPLSDKAFLACMEIGEITFAGYLSTQICWYAMETGDPLDDGLKVIEKHLAFARQTRNDAIHTALRVRQQFVAALRGSVAPMSFGDTLENTEGFAELRRTALGPGYTYYDVLKQTLAFLFGRYDEALASARRVAATADQMRNLAFETPHCFYFALTLTALFAQSPAAEQRDFAQTLARLLEKLKFRADQCPANWFNQYALVAAEVARIEGRERDASRLYEQAIRSAHDNGFVQNEGLAYELASAFYRARGYDLFADTYLRQARACYLRWGADGKVRQLDERYPQLQAQAARAAAMPLEAAAHLDLLSVAKASQAISGRILLDELVDTLMRIVIESAGAQSGTLLLVRGDELTLAAEASVAARTVQLRRHRNQPVPEAALPAAILNYVRRSREPVLLADVAQPHPFSSDDYFARRQPKSLLCLPIVRQSALIGLLYLENNLLTHAFTPERVTVLELLAAQAAISLENALLYADLRQENSERQRAEEALRKAHDELELRVLQRTRELQRSNEQLEFEIVERKRTESVLAQRSQELARSNAELEQLAYVASHDLQEPLRMVANYLQLLEQRYKDRLDAAANEFIWFAVDGAKRMQILIDDLLAYSRVGTKAKPMQPTEAAAAVTNAMQAIRLAIEDSGAEIRCGALPAVMGDPQQLTQLFQNLLANAIKFHGQQPPRIRIDAERQDGCWCFSVQDNGIGIAAEYFERIFVMFQRLHSRRAYAGTGIGLAICKKIVDHHGGRLWVESVAGQGSTFKFTLPQA